MKSRSLGASRVLVWPRPGATIAVMGAATAIGILHRRSLAEVVAVHRERVRAELTRRHRREAGSIDRAVAVGVVDEIVDPPSTRRRLIEVLAELLADRGTHTNIPL